MAEVSRLGTHWHKCVPPFCEGHRSIRLSVGKEPSKLPDFFPVCQRRGCVRANESTKIPQFWAHSRAQNVGAQTNCQPRLEEGGRYHTEPTNFFLNAAHGCLDGGEAPPPPPNRSLSLDFRLKAYRRWLQMEPPQWSDNRHPPIDYQGQVPVVGGNLPRGRHLLGTSRITLSQR